MSYFGIPLRNGLGLGLGTTPSLTSTPLSYRLAPSLNLQFAGAETLDPRITFTRTTTATFVNSSGVLSTAAIDAPRFDYNPATLAPLGLLIEEPRTNLILQSETLGTTWTTTNTSISANATTSPANDLTADKVVENTATGTHSVNQTVAATISTTYTISAYVKSDGTNRQFCIFMPAAIYTTGSNSIFNVTTGTIVSDEAGTAKITNAGNGWYRCSVTRTSTIAVSGTYQFRLINPAAANPLSYLGDGTSGVFVWGAQLEAGAFATSYIPTIASQVTRTADNASMTGTNFSSWFNQPQGTLYSEAAPLAAPLTPGGRPVFHLRDTISNTSQIDIRYRPSVKTGASVVNSGVTQADTSSIASYTTSSGKLAMAYNTNDVASTFNAEAVQTDTSVTIPTTLITALIGSDSIARFNGTISRIAYYPSRLSNAELQAITT
jgi:hypothetical protein